MSELGMKKLQVVVPDTKENKYCSTGGDWLRGPNCEKIKVSPQQIVKLKKKSNKALGIDKFISVIHVLDNGEYYSVSCC